MEEITFLECLLVNIVFVCDFFLFNWVILGTLNYFSDIFVDLCYSSNLSYSSYSSHLSYLSYLLTFTQTIIFKLEKKFRTIIMKPVWALHISF